MAIYSVDGEFVCSSGGVYLIGAYESEKACRMAFKTPDSVLLRIWESKRESNGIVPEDVCITEEDLIAAKEASNE
jgi:hypothetical protein